MYVNFKSSDDTRQLVKGPGDMYATVNARGLYNTFQFVLRLSPEIHRRLAALPNGIVSAKDVDFDDVSAFSTYLHETIHWWQHVGSTYGLMLSLSHPTETQGNYTHLKDLIAQCGFKKSIRLLIEQIGGPKGPGTLLGLANTIVNNSFDISSFRRLTLSPQSARAVIGDPLFECVGHSYEIAYGNNVLVLGATADPEHKVIPHPKNWEPGFADLRAEKKEGFFYGSRVTLAPLGSYEVFEGQARFGQLQYLYFASGSRLTWDDASGLGLLDGIYVEAFKWFLKLSELPWPDSIEHPIVGLFLLICDMAINPGAGFPFEPKFLETFISDTDPGRRFIDLSRIVFMKCAGVASAIRKYSRTEYDAVSRELAAALIIEPPLEIAECVVNWISRSATLQTLMAEQASFNYSMINLVPRVLLSHFLAFAQDKLTTPEFFCWPGAWMAGERVSERASALFDRHGALFVDKGDNDGIFPRLHPNKEGSRVQSTFDGFYASNLNYHMTRQWIVDPGDFVYNYRWLSESGSQAELKSFVDRHFEDVYGVRPNQVKLL
jgi:hypothetical protein